MPCTFVWMIQHKMLAMKCWWELISILPNSAQLGEVLEHFVDCDFFDIGHFIGFEPGSCVSEVMNHCQVRSEGRWCVVLLIKWKNLLIKTLLNVLWRFHYSYTDVAGWLGDTSKYFRPHRELLGKFIDVFISKFVNYIPINTLGIKLLTIRLI